MKKILLIGDSLINCSNLDSRHRWINLLKRQNNFEIINRSINGITTEDLIKGKEKIKKLSNLDYLIISIGTNDSVYWLSNKGKPRVKIQNFKYNLNELFFYYKSLPIKKIIAIIPHLFLKSHIEINNRTHNQNIIFYKKNLIKYANYYKIDTINMTNQFKIYAKKEYCEKLPDGIHLNNFGSKKYYEFILKKLKIND